MNFNEEDIRSDVGFVCIGQAAGNIGLLFEEKGYNVLYINTSSEDLALLKNAKHVYHVPNGEGCAKDRDKAKYHLANDIDHLLDLIETKVPQKNVFVVFASGGGTGSGISPYLLNILLYYVMSTTQDIDKKSIFVEFGEPLDTFQTFNEKNNIILMTGMSFPLDRLKGISTRVKAKRDKIEDSYEGLIENGLIDDVSLTKKRKKKVTTTTTPTGEVKRAPKKSAMELLAQYRR